MARSSAGGNTYYRVAVDYEYSNGREESEHFGPYATLGVAKSMLNRHKPTPAGQTKGRWRVIKGSRIESITGDWVAVDG